MARLAHRGKPRVCIVALNSAVPRLLGLVRDEAVGSQAVGGIEVQVVTLARLLAQRDWAVTMLVGELDGMGETRQVDGVSLATIDNRRHDPLGRLQVARKLAALVRELPADVFLVQGAQGMAGLLSFFCHRADKRFIFWLASDTDALCQDARRSRVPRGQRRLAAYGIRTADAVVVQTAYQGTLVADNFRRQSETIPNLWPVDSMRPHPISPLTVLWVANLRWEKRPDWVPQIAAAVPEINFTMVGGPMVHNEDLYSHIQRQSRQLENFNYVGFVPFAGVAKHFEQASIFLNTSVVEGFPNTFLQAWDAELPTVTSFDPDGMVVREKLGFHCTTIPEFAERVRLLARDASLRQQLGRRAKDCLRANFSPEAVLPKLECLLTTVTERASRLVRHRAMNCPLGTELHADEK